MKHCISYLIIKQDNVSKLAELFKSRHNEKPIYEDPYSIIAHAFYCYGESSDVDAGYIERIPHEWFRYHKLTLTKTPRIGDFRIMALSRENSFYSVVSFIKDIASYIEDGIVQGYGEDNDIISRSRIIDGVFFEYKEKHVIFTDDPYEKFDKDIADRILTKATTKVLKKSLEGV